jgi:co-chaperonin GroES (HSP10)
MLTSPVDKVLVQLEKTFQDEIILESGVKLFKYTALTPEWDATCVGKVVSVPRRLSKRTELKGMGIEIASGDEVILSYMVVFDCDLRDRNTPIHHNLFFHEGQYYWKVDYFHILGYFKDGEMIPAAGYVFLEEIKEVRQPLMQNGLWMPDMTVKERTKGKAKVIGVGKNKTQEPKLSVEKGDTVRFADRYACKYEVKGRQIIILPQQYLLAIQN